MCMYAGNGGFSLLHTTVAAIFPASFACLCSLFLSLRLSSPLMLLSRSIDGFEWHIQVCNWQRERYIALTNTFPGP